MIDAAKKTIVISGINMTNSGLLSIITDCLSYLSKYSTNNNIRIIALVHDKFLFDIPNIEYIEFPKSKKSWFARLYYEYFYFNQFSKQLNADIWFSLHDISPKVTAKKKFVYCHNASPFFKPTFKDWRFGFKICLFSLFYKYLYQINIKSNTAVIVQQNAIKESFQKMFGIDNVVVAHPEIVFENPKGKANLNPDKIHFFYPSYPRMFKNFEYIVDAFSILPEYIQSKIEIHFTLNKEMNDYANYIAASAKNYPSVKCIGLLKREEVLEYYNTVNVLLFPSRLETWGLPLSEFKPFEKDIFAINLPYAKETVGSYEKVHYFEPEKPQTLARLITDYVENNLEKSIPNKNIEAPDFKNWNSLFDFIFKEN